VVQFHRKLVTEGEKWSRTPKSGRGRRKPLGEGENTTSEGENTISEGEKCSPQGRNDGLGAVSATSRLFLYTTARWAPPGIQDPRFSPSKRGFRPPKWCFRPVGGVFSLEKGFSPSEVVFSPCGGCFLPRKGVFALLGGVFALWGVF